MSQVDKSDAAATPFEQAFQAALRERREPSPDVGGLASYARQFEADARLVEGLDLTPDDMAVLAIGLLELGETHAVRKGGRIVQVRNLELTNGSGFWVAEAVGRDYAFLLDSAIAACRDLRMQVRGAIHPVIERGHDRYSFIQIHLGPLDTLRMATLESALKETFNEVELANRDYVAMRDRMREEARRITANADSSGQSAADRLEAGAFLEWLCDDNFIFLGAREYVFARENDGRLAAHEPIPISDSDLGVLRNTTQGVLSRRAEPTVLTESVREFLNEPSAIIIAKASFISRVHRRRHADYIGVKTYDADGGVAGEVRFVGLLTSEAYAQSADLVPIIRTKIARVRAMHPRKSRFSIRALNSVLQSYPRDELLQIADADLMRITEGVLKLKTAPGAALFIRRDRFDRYVSALIYCPREAYSAERRSRAHTLLANAFGGRTSAFYPSFPEETLALAHLIIGLNPGHPEPDEVELSYQIKEIFSRWEDGLEQEAQAHETSSDDISRYRFTDAYKEAFTPREAFHDIKTILSIPPGQALQARICSTAGPDARIHLKIYHRSTPLALSSVVPILENMGFGVVSEVPYPIRSSAITGSTHQDWHVHHIVTTSGSATPTTDQQIERAFEAIWRGESENDAFNSLTPLLGVHWRSAALLRTLCRFRNQSGLDPSEGTQIRALQNHRHIAKDLLCLFDIKFNPDLDIERPARETEASRLEAKILKDLETVPSIEDDKCLRRILSAVSAAVRTNFYLEDRSGQNGSAIAIKFHSRAVEPLPDPRPLFEIFVWSPDVEGSHLRFGPVARGGIRWSDRRDDFRTEVLGLVKAQQVKNAVIVPVGAKGAFFPKSAVRQSGREAVHEAVKAAYRQFISALLQITDNIDDNKIVRDSRLVTWDMDDPYLVVAADKGTATFSDMANALALDRGFWLGDAFASGGSAGYDHKKMGITARGAWEAVRRHFRELGRNVQTDTFTVIAVGDMSGDVFGNGMLRSRQTRLLAAFNHQHIFLDPGVEDTQRAWRERKRLFDKPRSTWDDYDRAIISPGGGVFERTAKSIPITPEVAQLTGLTEQSCSPDDLVRALLESQVDLLWFGGIGAFVKSSTESHIQVADKANDSIRVDADRLRARVVAEGANLGLTQAARVEFARQGGKINTDAIDNSAGVDCSDHEVNIKILLEDAIGAGDLQRRDRNALLERMSDDVAQLVLRNNYDQTLALSIFEHTAHEDLEGHARLIARLETGGLIRRDIEGLPTETAIRDLERRKLGLTRPELAVLMAHAKLDLFARLIRSSAPDDPGFEGLLAAYFPPALAAFKHSRAHHRLRREIVATLLSNRIVNLAGPAFVSDKINYEGREAGRIAQALEAALSIFQLNELVERINLQDDRVPSSAQLAMLTETTANLRVLASVFASSPHLSEGGSVIDLIDRYKPAIGEIRRFLPDVLSPFVLSRIEGRRQTYCSLGAPADLSFDVALVRALASSCEILDISQKSGWGLKDVAIMHHAVGSRLRIDELRAAARDASADDEWERLAIQRIADELPRQQAELTLSVIESTGTRQRKDGASSAEMCRTEINSWLLPRSASSDRLSILLETASGESGWTLAKLVLLSEAVREIVHSCRRPLGAA